MRDFFEYKDEIHRCSQCGLCMAVCPLYKETKNDCVNARGLFSMLNAVIENKLEFDSQIYKYLNMCIKCDKCMKFCPSGINIPKIIDSAQKYFVQECNKNVAKL